LWSQIIALTECHHDDPERRWSFPGYDIGRVQSFKLRRTER